jgi:hypothetical protein
MQKLLAVLLLLVAVLCCSAAVVQDQIDWPAALGRHDPTWNMLPPKWDSGAFLGNGQLGAMIYAPETGPGLRWHIGRSDVTYRGNRIPIGDLWCSCRWARSSRPPCGWICGTPRPAAP